MKNIKKLVVIIFAALLTSACSDVRFDKLPGMYQDLIPMEIQGKYVYYGKDFRSKLLDTLIVNIGHNEITMNGSNGETKLTIHQDFNLHKLGDIYVIGTQDHMIKSLWNLCVFEPNAKGFNFYTVNNKQIKPGAENKLDVYFPFLDVPFTYEPIPAEPIALTGGDGGSPVGAPKMFRYYTISDEQFKNYFETELKDKEFISFKKDTKEKSKKSK